MSRSEGLRPRSWLAEFARVAGFWLLMAVAATLWFGFAIAGALVWWGWGVS